VDASRSLLGLGMFRRQDSILRAHDILSLREQGKENCREQ